MKKQKNYVELKNLVKLIERNNKNELSDIEFDIDEIIGNRITEENIISKIFDRMLSIVFIAREDLEPTYYKLLNYCREFDEKLSDDYDEIFKEQYTDDESEEDL